CGHGQGRAGDSARALRARALPRRVERAVGDGRMRRRLVIVGDVLLDRDLTGKVERLSPDAPVPVVDLEGERRRPGGAGLAAWFAAGDGLDVTLVTAIADDEAGAIVARLLRDRGVRVLAGER